MASLGLRWSPEITVSMLTRVMLTGIDSCHPACLAWGRKSKPKEQTYSKIVNTLAVGNVREYHGNVFPGARLRTLSESGESLPVHWSVLGRTTRRSGGSVWGVARCGASD